MAEPFYFYTQSSLVRLLGVTALSPAELLEGLKKVPLSSIYYHTHKFLQQHHYLSPEPPNDFAYWCSNILKVRELGEVFASVNVIAYRNLAELRAEFIRILSDYLKQCRVVPVCHESLKFYFMSCTTFVLQTPYAAHDVNEFVSLLEKVSVNSLYFHIFESRFRLERGENDFSAWLKTAGAEKAAEKISGLDPYTITLDRLRKKIMEIIKKYGPY